MSAPARIVFHPEAVAEASAAFAWYSTCDASAGRAFLAELDHAVQCVLEAPDAWPLSYGKTRRCLFERFPFSLFYRVADEEIQIIAVAHAKRRPGYWRVR
jgi:plasmid stabilization system protein ParE